MVDPITTATIVVAHGFWRFFDAAGAYVTHNVGVYAGSVRRENRPLTAN